MSPEGYKLEQRHGKSRVRVSRVWRRPAADGGDLIVEWNVSISLLSDCLEAYTDGNNSRIVATDTMKNTVYAKAKDCSEVISVESFAILLARHFTTFYPQVTASIVNVVEKPWERVMVDGQPHTHGFKLGSEKHTTEVTLKKCGSLNLTSGIEGLALLKTTKSGFEGFARDPYTILPDTKERMLATEVTASWRYRFEHIFDVPVKLFCFTQRYQDVKKVLADTFFGPPNVGVYSPSVQNTLYLIAKAILNRFPEITSIQLKMPNIHFLPVNLSSRDDPNMVTVLDYAMTFKRGKSSKSFGQLWWDETVPTMVTRAEPHNQSEIKLEEKSQKLKASASCIEDLETDPIADTNL